MELIEIRDVDYRRLTDEEILRAVDSKDYDALIKSVYAAVAREAIRFCVRINRRSLCEDAFSEALTGVFSAAKKYDGSTVWYSYAMQGASYGLMNWRRKLTRKKCLVMGQLESIDDLTCKFIRF